MTNLSDLLHAGGSAKEATAIAFGTLSTGQTVALRSDGKVEAVSETTVTLQWVPSTTIYHPIFLETTTKSHLCRSKWQ